MKASSGTLARSLEPLVAMVWIFFVLLSLTVGVVWAFGIGDADVGLRNEGLRLTLQWLLRYVDFAWITLGAVNVYACLATSEGLGRARAWTGGLFLSVAALVVFTGFCGVPMGYITYSTQLGPKIGPVPMGLPLFWLCVMGGAREAAMRFFPRMSYDRVALVAGLLTGLTDLSVEPLAAKWRGWWFWRAAVEGQPPSFEAPMATALIWGAVGWLTVRQLREKSVLGSARPRSWKPIVVLAIFHGVFLAAHVGRLVRR